MTVDPTCPFRAIRQGSRPAAGSVKALARVRRRGHQEPRGTLVQQAGCATVDAPAVAVEDASLATSRWCRSRNCRRRVMPRRPYCCCYCYCRSHLSHCSCFFPCPCPCPCPYPCLCHRCWGWGQEGEGAPEGMAVPVMVGVQADAATEGALLLRALSRMWWSVPGLPSGPARSP
jgi:hypothetical protein